MGRNLVSPTAPSNLVIAISSRALFDLDTAHQVYEKKGLAAYSQYQIDNEQVPLNPGTAFGVVRKLLALNDSLSDAMQVEVVLLSRNSADTGLRVFNSMNTTNYRLPGQFSVEGKPLGAILFLLVANYSSLLNLMTSAKRWKIRWRRLR